MTGVPLLDAALVIFWCVVVVSIIRLTVRVMALVEASEKPDHTFRCDYATLKNLGLDEFSIGVSVVYSNTARYLQIYEVDLSKVQIGMR